MKRIKIWFYDFLFWSNEIGEWWVYHRYDEAAMPLLSTGIAILISAVILIPVATFTRLDGDQALALVVSFALLGTLVGTLVWLGWKIQEKKG